ncbi:MAG: CatB-related O-acetyltransferase [Deltaproteobacteria bacterium]|nr:CatB-related O-acetyltransferase [Deltaproteobacteria bacterium]MBW2359594.1 CatB-related O-acetyltransferase [Deltaproteobacteria bacterium]
MDAPHWVRVGDFSYGSPGVNRPRFLRHQADESVEIGRYCSLGAQVTFLAGGNHRLDHVSTYPFQRIFYRGPPEGVSRGPIAVGNDVWIGREALVLSGCTIGDGAVIGARSVVTRDVDPYAIVAGNPAVPIRLRFASEEVAALLRIRWWEWSPEMIHSRMAWFERPVAAFVAEFDPGA